MLDLVIEIENEKGSQIEELNIEPKIESDHLPVEIYIEIGEKEEVREGGKKKKEKKEYRMWWDKDLREEYENRVEKKAEGMEEEKGLGVQDRWERLTKFIWEVGWELKLVKELSKEGRDWEERDGNIRAQKRNM